MMKQRLPDKIKLRFVPFDDSSKAEVSKMGRKFVLDLTLKVLYLNPMLCATFVLMTNFFLTIFASLPPL